MMVSSGAIALFLSLLLINSSQAINFFNFSKKDFDTNNNKLGYKGDKYFIVLGGDKKAIALNMEAETLHKWDVASRRVKLLENCNLVAIKYNARQDAYLVELDLNSNILWQYDKESFAHHDFDIDKEGNITTFFSKALDPEIKIDNLCKNEEILADKIITIDRNGETLFEWKVYEEFFSVIENDKCTPERRESMASSKFVNMLDSIHPNSIQILKENKWYKKGHKEFKPGNLLITAHHIDLVFIVDKDSGKVVWRYQGDDLPLDKPHEAKMIHKGLPGYSNILIHDNGLIRGFSRILEINPITKETIWEYKKEGEFFNRISGTQQRLKNHDTLISEDTTGRMFIVDKNKKIKWQYNFNNNFELKRPFMYKSKDYAHCFE